MEGILLLGSILLVFVLGFHAVKELSNFMLRNRRGRKNYEYDLPEEEED